jgi:hypothetical protein
VRACVRACVRAWCDVRAQQRSTLLACPRTLGMLSVRNAHAHAYVHMSASCVSHRRRGEAVSTASRRHRRRRRRVRRDRVSRTWSRVMMTRGLITCAMCHTVVACAVGVSGDGRCDDVVRVRSGRLGLRARRTRLVRALYDCVRAYLCCVCYEHMHVHACVFVWCLTARVLGRRLLACRRAACSRWCGWHRCSHSGQCACVIALCDRVYARMTVFCVGSHDAAIVTV